MLHLKTRKEEILSKDGSRGTVDFTSVKAVGTEASAGQEDPREMVEPFCVCQRLFLSVGPGSGVEIAGEVEERGWWPTEGAFCTGRVYSCCYVVYVMKDSFW